jgi:hypothetical protein
VAHTFHIPIAFDFRRVAVQWTEVRAAVIGWARHQDGTLDPAYLIAGIGGKAEARQIKLPLSHLPAKERQRCLEMSGRPEADEGLKEMCASVDMTVFTHTRKTYIGEAELIKNTVPVDAMEMRADFLRLRGDSETALAFLNMWGRWTPHRNFVDWPELRELQQAVRQALTSSPAKWLSGNYSDLPTAHSRSSKFPYFGVLTDACQVAIRMTTTIDLLQQTKFQVCARPDCAVPFAVKSKHNRIYCTQYCAHLESVRRGRTAQRSE